MNPICVGSLSTIDRKPSVNRISQDALACVRDFRKYRMFSMHEGGGDITVSLDLSADKPRRAYASIGSDEFYSGLMRELISNSNLQYRKLVISHVGIPTFRHNIEGNMKSEGALDASAVRHSPSGVDESKVKSNRALNTWGNWKAFWIPVGMVLMFWLIMLLAKLGIIPQHVGEAIRRYVEILSI